MAHKTSKVEICNIDTGSLPRLTADELCSLMEQVKAGDTKARDRFIYCNLKLVLSVCKRFRNRKEDIDDIFQVGIVGLCKAVDNFDTKFGVRFSTYAVPMILGEIRRFLRDSSILRVSRGLRDVAYKALVVRDKIKTENSEPTIDEIAAALNLDRKLVDTALEAVNEPISIYTSGYAGGSDDDKSLCDIIYDEQDSGAYQLKLLCLKEALGVLDEREKEIINLRYYTGKTQIEVSDEVGISQAQVSRLEKNALAKLAEYV